MPYYLGLDTSNYTTSAAIYDTDSGLIRQQKLLLPVKPGEAGLRQSDAVFHHTRQLPEVAEALLTGFEGQLAGIGVSTRPRGVDGSYMPCFLCGEGTGRTMAAALRIPLRRTSHQVGHILAALYSADRLSWRSAPFLAFHVSGGTTDCVLCTPDDTKMIAVQPVSQSLDLKAGQAVDRVGLMLGLQFPCGPALETIAAESRARFRVKPRLRDGCCSLSGLENQCRRMLDDGAAPCDIAKYCLVTIGAVLDAMTAAALDTCGDLPVVYAGGVMSNRYLQSVLGRRTNTAFAAPAFSCDNAAGVAIFAALSDQTGGAV